MLLPHADRAAPVSASAAPSDELCFDDARAAPKGPSFCHGPGGTYIVGLPENHDWKPGMRVYLGTTDEITGSSELGVAAVLTSLPQAVEIRVLYQRPHSTLVGTTAQLAGSDKNPGGGRYLAHMTKREGSLITLDVGSTHGVKVGDIYEARDPKQRERPIGRAVVRTVHAGDSTAKVFDEVQPITADEWVQGGSEAAPRPRTIKVVVVPIKGAGPQPTMLRVREALAALKKLTGTLQFHLIESKPISPGLPGQLHEKLIQKARDHGADQILWMSNDCAKGTCEQVLHALVPQKAGTPLHPDPLLLPTKSGVQAAADARAILGQMAYTAGSFAEASYHLRMWAGGARASAPHEVITRLAQAELELGQLDRARMWLAQAAARKSSAQETSERLPTHLAQADLACKDADTDELARLEASLERSSKANPELRAAHLATLLCGVETSMQSNADPQRTDRLIKKGLTVSEALGDKPAQMTLKRAMARSLAAQGLFARADQQFAAALKIAVSAKDRRLQARIGLDRAIARERSRNVPQAERHARAACKLFKSLHDEQGLAECVPVMVRIERQLHGLPGAKAFLDAARSSLRGQHLDRALFAVGRETASLAIERGDLNQAQAELGSLTAAARKQKLQADEDSLQGMLAEYYLLSGQPAKARDLLDTYSGRIAGERPGLAQAHVQLLYARLSLQEGDAVTSRSQAVKALRGYVGAGDDAGAAAAHLVRAEVEREFGEKVAAESHYEEARRLFAKVQDTEGVYKVALGKAALVLWRGKTGQARKLFPSIVHHFEGSGNSMMALEASLLSEWADFEHTRASDITLDTLRTLQQRATKQKYARLAAEAQMLIACVHRRDSDHVVAEQELAAGQKLYGAIGRHAQQWPCDVNASSPAPVAATQHASR